MTANTGEFREDFGYQSEKDKTKRPKWPELMIELSLRAMRRLHFEYGIWGVGKQGQKTPPKPQQLNCGPGIELADEREVCAAITLEFMNSQMTSGFDRPPTGKANEEQVSLSFYGLDREWPYDEASKKQGRPLSADITFRRIRYSPANSNEFQRVVIEAKRFQRVSPVKTSQGQNGDVNYGPPQFDGIKEDIEKLFEKNKLAKEKFFAHVLVWGIWPIPTGEKDSVVDLLKKCRPPERSLRLHQLRWHPLDPGPPSPGSQLSDPTSVERWLWIALMEVT